MLEGFWQASTLLRIAAISLFVIAASERFVFMLIETDDGSLSSIAWAILSVMMLLIPALLIAICILLPCYLLNLARRAADRGLERAVRWRAFATPAAIIVLFALVVLSLQSPWPVQLLSAAIYLVLFVWLFDQFRGRIAEAIRSTRKLETAAT